MVGRDDFVAVPDDPTSLTAVPEGWTAWAILCALRSATAVSRGRCISRCVSSSCEHGSPGSGRSSCELGSRTSSGDIPQLASSGTDSSSDAGATLHETSGWRSALYSSTNPNRNNVCRTWAYSLVRRETRTDARQDHGTGGPGARNDAQIQRRVPPSPRNRRSTSPHEPAVPRSIDVARSDDTAAAAATAGTCRRHHEVHALHSPERRAVPVHEPGTVHAPR
ncbi:hypothetical protein M427DRAFT_386707 [Gonapodya prolifera JEL478]|uniref:Uncharacterized protein n=1 Tax=Gonapodya prolifera (strain JEL478) TaxID=1344416 RepID=A0A139A934_GONPJ|nr:hypothetical protein M427DRAFT_386707 [Gonapodya prolifera JEL478]|eukprot:KXS12913.1 hypothetical protein M427DRAFT_386707 [Gonapodya prolifera JEL478]